MGSVTTRESYMKVNGTQFQKKKKKTKTKEQDPDQNFKLPLKWDFANPKKEETLCITGKNSSYKAGKTRETEASRGHGRNVPRIAETEKHSSVRGTACRGCLKRIPPALLFYRVGSVYNTYYLLYI